MMQLSKPSACVPTPVFGSNHHHAQNTSTFVSACTTHTAVQCCLNHGPSTFKLCRQAPTFSLANEAASMSMQPRRTRSGKLRISSGIGLLRFNLISRSLYIIFATEGCARGRTYTRKRSKPTGRRRVCVGSRMGVEDRQGQFNCCSARHSQTDHSRRSS